MIQSERKRILSVDDEITFSNLLKENLEYQGYEVTYISDPETALEVFKECRGQDYDLCILDVMMPVMDGFVLCNKFKEIDPNVLIIFLSASESLEYKERAYKCNAYDYVSKNDLAILRYKIENALKSKSIKNKNVKYDNPEQIIKNDEN